MYHLLGPRGDNQISLPGDRGLSRTTWDGLARAVEGVAAALQRAGLQPGDAVAIEGRTCTEVVLTIFAAWRCGAAVTLLAPGPAGDPSAVVGEVTARRALLGVRAAYLPAAGWDRAPVGALAGLIRLDEVRVASAARDPAPAPSEPARSPGDVAVHQATSGTTGQPRIVPVTWAMLLANLAAITERLGLRRADSVVSWMPLYHDMGLIGYLALPAYLDAAVRLIPPADFAAAPAVFAEAVDAERGTFSGMTTYGLALLERALRREHTYDLSSLRQVVCGAEMMDLALCDTLVATGRRHGLRPDVFAFAYGLAEGALAVSIGPPAAPGAVEEDPRGPGDGWLRPRDRGFARLGPPVPGVEVRIATPGVGDADVRGATVGEIEIRGASVMAGYVGDGGPGPVTPGGWLRTGDLGYLTPDGEVVVVGRSKDVLVVGGRKLSPDDVERVVGRIPGVRRGRVVALAELGPAGEGFSIVAERAGTGHADERAVRAALRRQLGVTPLRVVFVPAGALPRTTSGKLRRSAARAALAPPDAGPPRTTEGTGRR
jgi:fatty-acyl-CoA synthase